MDFFSCEPPHVEARGCAGFTRKVQRSIITDADLVHVGKSNCPSPMDSLGVLEAGHLEVVAKLRCSSSFTLAT